MSVDVETLVADARLKYDGIEDVAFIGSNYSGKTVVGSLLVYCMTVYWAARRQGVHPVVTSGTKRLREALEGMKKGRYPPKTQMNQQPDTVITINDTRGKPSEYDVVLHDMSGEDHVKLLSEDGDLATRLGAILRKGLGHLIFGKKYMIMVDCSLHESWDADSGHLGAAILRLKKMREMAYKVEGKIAVPVAVVFTKSDTLPKNLQKAPAHKIALQYQPLMNSLKSSCEMSMVKFFKSKIYTIKDPDHDVKHHEQDEPANPEENNAEESNAEQINPKDDDVDRSGGHRIAIPLKYNSSEYSRMVSWIVDS